MWKLKHRRSRIEVTADILRLGEAGKTTTMHTLNLSHHELQKYLHLLLKFKLVDNVTFGDRSVTYIVTKKGLMLLRNIQCILGMLERNQAINPCQGYDSTKTVV